MAVQKNRKTRSKRGMRRAHDALKGNTLSKDAMTGETHRRHHVAAIRAAALVLHTCARSSSACPGLHCRLRK